MPVNHESDWFSMSFCGFTRHVRFSSLRRGIPQLQIRSEADEMNEVSGSASRRRGVRFFRGGNVTK